MSTTVQLVPNDQITTHDGFGGTDWTYSNAGFSDGAVDLADANDSTIWYNGNPHPAGTQTAEFAFTTDTIPADANIVSVTLSVRWRAAAALGATIKDQVGGGTQRQVGTLTGFGLNNPNTNTQVMTAQTTNPSGGAWSQSDINDLRIVIQKTSGAGLQINDVWADVLYSSPPSATVSAPTGEQTSTNQPDVVWSYSDVDSDAQTQYHVKIFTQADYEHGSFDADTFPAVWDSTATASAATTVQVGEALASGVTYKAFVRVADSLSGFGDWAAGPTFSILASGHDQPGRVFFALTSGPGSSGAGFWEFDDDNREGSFRFKSAPLRDPGGRQVEIREVHVYCKSYDASAFVRITVNGTARTETMTVPGRHHLRFLFSERNEVLDVLVESEAGAPDTQEAPTIEVVRIGWRPNHMLR